MSKLLSQRSLFLVMLIVTWTWLTPASAWARQFTGLWDSSGKMLLPIEYDEIRREGDKFIARSSCTDDKGLTTVTQMEIDTAGKQLTKPYTVPAPVPQTAKIEPKLPIPDGWKFETNNDFGCIVTREVNQRAFLDPAGKLTVFPSEFVVEPIGPGLFLKHIYPDSGEHIIELLGEDLKKVAVLPPKLNLMNSHFKDGLLKVRTESGIIAFINAKGEFQIKPSSITEAKDFKNGKCKVTMITRDGNAAAIIDKDGIVVAGPYEKAEFLYDFKDSDQVVVEFDGERAGVVTTSGKQIIPFDNDFIIEYGDKYLGRKDGQWNMYSRDGKTIRMFPPSICNIEPCGNLWRFAEGGDPGKLQNTFRGNPYPGSKFGLMDDAGKVVIPAQFPAIVGEINDGLVLIGNSNQDQFCYGVLNLTTKKVVLEPQFKTVALKDGFIFAYEDRHEFDPLQWKNSRGSTNGWSDFLYSYNLIGMTKIKVEALLGKPLGPYESDIRKGTTSGKYMLQSTCTGWSGVEIEYSNREKATGWRDVVHNRTEDWHRHNVVLIQKGRPDAPLVVPKKAASQYSSKL